jgi:hypothetical protein
MIDQDLTQKCDRLLTENIKLLRELENAKYQVNLLLLTIGVFIVLSTFHFLFS